MEEPSSEPMSKNTDVFPPHFFRSELCDPLHLDEQPTTPPHAESVPCSWQSPTFYIGAQEARLLRRTLVKEA